MSEAKHLFSLQVTMCFSGAPKEVDLWSELQPPWSELQFFSCNLDLTVTHLATTF